MAGRKRHPGRPRPTPRPKVTLRRSGPTSSRPYTTRRPVSKPAPKLLGPKKRPDAARRFPKKESGVSGLAGIAARTVGKAARKLGGAPVGVPRGFGSRGQVRAPKLGATARLAGRVLAEESGVLPAKRLVKGKGKGSVWDYLAVAGAAPVVRGPASAGRLAKRLAMMDSPARKAENLFAEVQSAAQRGSRLPMDNRTVQQMVDNARAGRARGVEARQVSHKKPDSWTEFLGGNADPFDYRHPVLVHPDGRIRVGPRGTHHNDLAAEGTDWWNYGTGREGTTMQGALWVKPANSADPYLDDIVTNFDLGTWAHQMATKRQLAAINRWIYGARWPSGR